MPLSRKLILQRLSEHRDELAAMGVLGIALFGSFARGEEQESSDVDILVDLIDARFDRYMDVKEFLSGVLGRQVDLVMKDALKPRLRSAILSEAVYGA